MIGKMPENSQTNIRPAGRDFCHAKIQNVPAGVLPQGSAKIIGHSAYIPAAGYYARLQRLSHVRCSHASKNASP